MANNALNLRDNRSQILGPFRDGHIHQLLNRPTVCKIIVHGTDIIQPIGVRNELVVGTVLRELFHSSVEEPHHRSGFDDPLAFQLKDNLQHPMRAGVLRTHIEQQLLSPENRKGFGLRVFRVNLIDGASLILELGHDGEKSLWVGSQRT